MADQLSRDAAQVWLEQCMGEREMTYARRMRISNTGRTMIRRLSAVQATLADLQAQGVLDEVQADQINAIEELLTSVAAMGQEQPQGHWEYGNEQWNVQLVQSTTTIPASQGQSLNITLNWDGWDSPRNAADLTAGRQPTPASTDYRPTDPETTHYHAREASTEDSERLARQIQFHRQNHRP